MARPAFKPTPELRKLVQNLAGIGVPQGEILLCVPDWGTADGKPIALKTLYKHFRIELDRGLALYKMKARKMLHELIADKHFGALVFYLKTQCGYSETVKVEATGRDGAPLAPLAQVVVFLPKKDERPEDALPNDSTSPVSIAATPPASQPEAAQPLWQEPPRSPAPATSPPEPTAAGSVRPSGYMYPTAADMRR